MMGLRYKIKWRLEPKVRVCELHRGAHINAPLALLCELGRVNRGKVREGAARTFWAGVRAALSANVSDASEVERLAAFVARTIPEPPSVAPPLRRPQAPSSLARLRGATEPPLSRPALLSPEQRRSLLPSLADLKAPAAAKKEGADDE